MNDSLFIRYDRVSKDTMISKYHGIIHAREDKLIFKLYTIFREGFDFGEVMRPMIQNIQREARETGTNKEKRLLSDYSGVGFAILTDGYLKLNVWDSEMPERLHHIVSAYDSGKKSTLKEVKSSGISTVHVNRLINWESEMWRKHINNPFENTLEQYLSEIKEGPL